MNDIKLDRYRLIKGTNTQTRNLYIALNILKILGQSSLPLSFLNEKTLKWDVKEKISSTWYKEHNGELTNLSFNYYIDLLKEIGFLSQIGEVVRSSRNGQLYLFLNENQEASKRLKDWEKIFLLYFILQKDSDAIICLLDLIADHEEGIIEKDIRQKFNNYLIKRLKAKIPILPAKARDDANQKLRELSLIDLQRKLISKDSTSINKHSVPVRLEWLVDIGILKREKKKYQISSKGKKFYENLIRFSEKENVYKDITENWLKCRVFSVIGMLVDVKPCNDIAKYINKLRVHLMNYFNKFSTDGAYRLNVEAVYIYLIISSIKDTNTYVEINDLEKIFEKGIVADGLFFYKKEGGRKNESYISIKIL